MILSPDKQKICWIFIILFTPNVILCQSLKGKVVSSETNSGIGYVNIGVIGKGVGTVTDEFGNFTLDINPKYEDDSIRFSIVGYLPRTFLVGQLKDSILNNIILTQTIHELKEVKIVYRKTKNITMGIPITTRLHSRGFIYNDLGTEIGINVYLKNQVLLKDINLNIAFCDFDTVTYRLNIYELKNQTNFINILSEQIIISFSKNKIKEPINFDLEKYSIKVKGNVLITLEQFKYLGRGYLMFLYEPNISSTYYRKTSEDAWHTDPGVIGIYLHGQEIK